MGILGEAPMHAGMILLVTWAYQGDSPISEAFSSSLAQHDLVSSHASASQDRQWLDTRAPYQVLA